MIGRCVLLVLSASIPRAKPPRATEPTGRAFFWIGLRSQPQTGAHIAFTSKDRETVDAFYAEALAAGGRDNGPPGPRPHYHQNYYGAFILDPDGHNIEAVCHLAGG